MISSNRIICLEYYNDATERINCYIVEGIIGKKRDYMRKIANQLWIQQEGDLTIIGMTPELQEETGDISYAYIANLGEIEVDDTLLNVEASKAAIEVPSPLKGIVVERNEAAEEDPSLLNDVSVDNSWLVKLSQVEPEAFALLADA